MALSASIIDNPRNCPYARSRGLTATPRVGPHHSAARQRHARRACLRVSNVAEFTSSNIGAGKEALLCAKFAGHTAALAAAVVLEDTDHRKQVVTTSLDKTLAVWTSEGTCDAFGSGSYTEAGRLTPPGGPVFSILLDDRSDDGMASQVYLGNHGKQVLAWVPPRPELESGVVLDGHCGWVRALASAGKRWLCSAACNQLRTWDMARAVPSAAGLAVLDKGDILALAATKDRVFTGGADGSIRAFSIGKKGELVEAAARTKAHGDRVTSLVLDRNRLLLFSSSYDGTVKAWDPATLEIVVGVQGAHEGQRVHCLALGPDGVLYSGGSDQLVRRWQPGLLQPAAGPLYAHSHSVRTLAAGARELLVSGDKGGEVVVWKVA